MGSGFRFGRGRRHGAEAQGPLAVLEPVGRPPDVDDGGVVEQPVQDGAGDRRVPAEYLAPLHEALVAGEDDGSALVTPGDQLEEEGGLPGLKGKIAHFINDQDGVLGQGEEPVLQGVGGERGHQTPPQLVRRDPEIEGAVTARARAMETDILAECELGKQVLTLRAEKENLLDTVWLATSSSQIKELWEQVNTLLELKPTPLEEKALTIAPVELE